MFQPWNSVAVYHVHLLHYESRHEGKGPRRHVGGQEYEEKFEPRTRSQGDADDGDVIDEEKGLSARGGVEH